MNRRQFLGRSAFFFGAFSAQAVSLAASKAPVPASPAAKTPAPKTAIPKPQTVIYAFGASLFFQDLDGSTAREEKLALPKGFQIEYLSGSRDGRTLAFSAGRTVYFYNPDSKELTPLAPKSGESYLYPCISPDGQSVSCRQYRADAVMCVISRDGTERDLGPSTKGVTKSRWTPDGKTIYFSTGPHLLRIASQGGEAEPFVRGHYIENFSINAQGLIIAPVPTESSSKPTLLDENGEMTKLDFALKDFNNPTWSPGGTSVAFSLRPRYAGNANAQGLYIWKNIKTQQETRKVSDAQSNGESGFVWR